MMLTEKEKNKLLDLVITEKLSVWQSKNDLVGKGVITVDQAHLLFADDLALLDSLKAKIIG